MTSDDIKNYCEEATNISNKQGLKDGLTYLIGEKFSLVYYQLKIKKNKLKYIYPDYATENLILKNNKTLNLSYTLTISENYIGVLERVAMLEEALDQFIKEIKESFSLENIQNYIDSYPRLAFKINHSPENMISSSVNSSMTVDDIFSEIEDILIIDEIKKLFR